MLATSIPSISSIKNCIVSNISSTQSKFIWFRFPLIILIHMVERFKEAEKDDSFRKVKRLVEEEEGEKIVCLCS